MHMGSLHGSGDQNQLPARGLEFDHRHHTQQERGERKGQEREKVRGQREVKSLRLKPTGPCKVTGAFIPNWAELPSSLASSPVTQQGCNWNTRFSCAVLPRRHSRHTALVPTTWFLGCLVVMPTSLPFAHHSSYLCKMEVRVAVMLVRVPRADS